MGITLRESKIQEEGVGGGDSTQFPITSNSKKHFPTRSKQTCIMTRQPLLYADKVCRKLIGLRVKPLGLSNNLAPHVNLFHLAR